MTGLPGHAAIPGACVPGAAQPGSITGGTPLVLYRYGGTEELTYIDYIDTQAGHTLLATPGGGPYAMAPAGQGFDYGFTVPPPDGSWT